MMQNTPRRATKTPRLEKRKPDNVHGQLHKCVANWFSYVSIASLFLPSVDARKSEELGRLVRENSGRRRCRGSRRGNGRADVKMEKRRTDELGEFISYCELCPWIKLRYNDSDEFSFFLRFKVLSGTLLRLEAWKNTLSSGSRNIEE
ncbi:hypothetical protein AVEN_17594-1 [Araneus ventricosus]|uniref:Uncharacterized protein n=1 Tax=Araneus ventricosus TaxID=182803 RepID=A0A4Y2HWG5_ARAVE|nr:hypothetical protein AVEN_17594-1 [Araneus ventricosus]